MAKVEWTNRFKMRNGQIATYIGVSQISGRHRAVTDRCGNGACFTLDDNGICRVDGAEGPHDWVAAA